jgi:hypothetical protein
MMRTMIALAIAMLAVITWGYSGRHLTLLLDRLFTIGSRTLPVSPIQYGGGGFLIGGMNMTFAGTDNLLFGVELSTDSANRVVLSKGKAHFTLGPRLNPIDSSGRPEIDVSADGSDQLSFTSSRSPLSWPNWLEFRIMGGPPPRWKRYVYYRLLWTKSWGATLDMRWRYEQQNYSQKGWTEPMMMWNSQTGLLTVEIRSPLEDAVVRYVERVKHWTSSAYRIESRGSSTDGASEIFAVVHVDDVRGSAPGAGKSIELYVDRATQTVIRELGAQ